MLKTVKVSTQKPPQWILDAVKEQFGVVWESNVIFTYGDIISTYKGEMTEDLLTHEGHHTVQQENFGGPDKWWREYLANPQFRFNQELECYQRQYKWLKENEPNGMVRAKMLGHYATSLSGEMYGKLCTYDEAKEQIKSYTFST